MKPEKTIWKFPLTIEVEQTIEVPGRPYFLDAGIQGGAPVLWAIVDPEAAPRTRRIGLYDTGKTLPRNPGTYLATLSPPGGLVWHVFDQGFEAAVELAETFGSKT